MKKTANGWYSYMGVYYKKTDEGFRSLSRVFSGKTHNEIRNAIEERMKIMVFTPCGCSHTAKIQYERKKIC